MIKKISHFSLCFILLFFSSCKTLKQPESIPSPLNYTDEDVVLSEIERIEEMKQTEPVKALWHAVMLDRQDIIDECFENTKKFLELAINDKDYTEAFRLWTSLYSVRQNDEITELKKDVDELFTTNGFEIGDNSDKNPKTISDCVKATVTIWVDKGLKVENGAGFADIIIGSGFFIDKSGYIVTNHHVIEDLVNPKYEGFSRLYVKMQPDTDVKIPAKVIGYDPLIDLALLKIEVEPEFVLTLGSSSDLHVGDKVSAIGTPVGLEGTLTSGIISSVDRKLITLGNVFQIDAAVNSGNSGGPLIDENMQVQAIVFAGMLQFQGLNFAIPVEYLKQELQYLYAGGEVQHSWIGGYGRTFRSGKKQKGLEVQYVIPGSTACMTGLKEDDVIINVAGQEISNLDDFQMLLLKYEPGTLLNCKYLTKDGVEKQCMLYLEKRSDKPNALAFDSDFMSGSFIPMFGMKLKQASTTNKYSFVIDKVIRGGIADETSFSEGDFVVVRDIKIDTKNKYVAVQLSTQRKTKGFLDIVVTLTNSLDSPFYF